MKKKTSLISQWYVKLILLFLTIVLGIIGFWAYYAETEGEFPLRDPFYSTFSLFTLNYEFDEDKIENVPHWILAVLLIARYSAAILTGEALFELLRPYFAKFQEKLAFCLWNIKKKDHKIYFGNNAENRWFIMSDDKSEDNIIVCSEDNTGEKLEGKGFRYIHTDDPESILSEQIQSVFRNNGEKLSVVINTNNEEDNFLLGMEAINCIRELLKIELDELADITKILDDKNNKKNKAEEDGNPDEAARIKAEMVPFTKKQFDLEKLITEKFSHLQIIVLGSKKYQAAYEKLQRISQGPVKYTNKYQIIANNFIFQYPITKYIQTEGRDLLDKEHPGCVVQEADFNMILIGFGDTNQEIFLASIGTNVLIESRDNSIPKMKMVNYHIFDSKNSLYDKNLNHSVFRYQKEFLADKKNEVPKNPIDPVSDKYCTFHKTDVDNHDFYEEIHDICGNNNNNSISYIIVAFGDDLINIDLSLRLLSKMKEWGLTGVYIYTKICSTKNEQIIKEFSEKHLIPFGNEQFPVNKLFRNKNDIEKITFEKAKKGQKNRLPKNLIISETMKDEIENVYTDYAVYTMHPTQWLANIYNILGLRLKMNLMGLDFKKREDNEDPKNIISREKFDAIYRDNNTQENKYPEVIPARINIRNNNIRNNLAIQEHYRWNGFMIMSGFIPAESGKDYDLRFHADIADEEALLRFEKDKVIEYDYKLMDGAWEYLDKAGYVVYQRNCET